jgi:hypothetical protein
MMMKRHLSILSALVAPAVLALAVSLPAAPALAQGSSCQDDFQKLGAARQAAISRINGFSRGKANPVQVCAAARQLVSADTRLIDWMTNNKDWCQVPDEAIENLTKSRGQGVDLRNRACGAAAQQQRLIQQQRRLQQQQEAAGGGGAAPAPGSGIRLPQGAL